mgnify:CR=1 FL=1
MSGVSLLNKNIKGVYELSSSIIKKYPFSQNNIIYIGSSKNIKKRLLTYTSKNGIITSIDWGQKFSLFWY